MDEAGPRDAVIVRQAVGVADEGVAQVPAVLVRSVGSEQALQPGPCWVTCGTEPLSDVLREIAYGIWHSPLPSVRTA
jgi:hypothetical protein